MRTIGPSWHNQKGMPCVLQYLANIISSVQKSHGRATNIQIADWKMLKQIRINLRNKSPPPPRVSRNCATNLAHAFCKIICPPPRRPAHLHRFTTPFRIRLIDGLDEGLFVFRSPKGGRQATLQEKRWIVNYVKLTS